MNKSSKKLIFVATTPFAVNSFLKLHLLSLSKYYNVTLLVNKRAYPLLEEIEECVEVISINFHRGISIWKDLIALLTLCLVFIQIKPYSVHSITPKAGLLAMLAASITLVPNRIHTFTGQVWSTKIGFSRSVLKFLDRVLATLANYLFSDSYSQIAYLESEGIVKRGVVRCLGPGSISGVPLHRFKPDITVRSQIRNSTQLPDTVTIFLFLGRISRDKGIEDLLNAFRRLIKFSPNSALWIVGPDEGGLSESMKMQFLDLKLPIFWFDSTHYPEQYMCGADVLVLPSYREGFGSVIIEAAACGVPSIAYKIYGVSDAIEHGVTGVLTSTGNWISLSDEMLKLTQDIDRRNKMGKAALLRVREKYSDVKITNLWLNFYHELLSPK